MKSTRRNIYIQDDQWNRMREIALEESQRRGTSVTISDVAREGHNLRIRLADQRRKNGRN